MAFFWSWHIVFFCILMDMKKLEKYYPIILAAFSVGYSNYLWFSGNQLDGIYVGLWPVTILAFAIALRQRRRDSKNDENGK